MWIKQGESSVKTHVRGLRGYLGIVQGPSGGKMWALFGGNPLDPKAECATGKDAAPPVTISNIVILGAQSGSSFNITTTAASDPTENKQAVAAAESDAKNTTITFDKTGQQLHISGVNFQLKCPTGFELTWA
jgi:hypothetical protein